MSFLAENECQHMAHPTSNIFGSSNVYGKPIKLIHSSATEVIALKCPANLDPSILKSTLNIEIEEDIKTTSGCPIIGKNWQFFNETMKGKCQAKLSSVDTSTHFIMIEQKNCIEIIPIQGWYSVHCVLKQKETDFVESTDISEKNHRLALLNEEKKNLLLSRKHDAEEDDVVKFKSSKMLSEVNKVYAEDGGLSIQQARRLKSALKARKQKYLNENEDLGDSALNIHEMKRAEVDWDWDDDGKASDDDEELEPLEEPREDEAYKRTEYFESDDDEEEVLTKFGQKVSSALEVQKEQDDLDELAQFSDDDTDLNDDVRSVTSSVSQPISVEEPKAKKAKIKQSEDVKGGPEALKQKIIRVLSQQGGRILSRDFIEQFNITNKQPEQFKLFRKFLNEVCEVYTENKNGNTVRYIELQSQYRT